MALIVDPRGLLRGVTPPPYAAAWLRSQFHCVMRVRNSGTQTIGDVECRMWLPISDGAQWVEWVRFVDVDPLVTSIDTRPWRESGGVNSYARFRLSSLRPGESAHFGYVAAYRTPFVPGASPPNVRRATDDPVAAGLDTDDLSDLEPTDDPGWPAARAALDAIDWDDVDARLQQLLSPSFVDEDGDPVGGPGGTRARRLAALLCAFVSAFTYGDGPGAVSSEGGYFNWAVPGSSAWAGFVRDRVETLRQDILEDWLFTPMLFGTLGATTFRGGIEGQVLDAIAARGWPACTCSENALLLVTLLRHAGLHARELSGTPVGDGMYTANAAFHRVVEVWDPKVGVWFVADTTTPQLGRWLVPRMQVALFRGRSGLHAPLGWGYLPEVVRVGEIRIVSLSPRPGESRANQQRRVWAERDRTDAGGPDEDRTDPVGPLADLDILRSRVNWRVSGSALTADEASEMKGTLRQSIEAQGWGNLLGLAGAVPAPNSGTITGESRAWTSFALAFLAPNTVADGGLQLSETYLLRPQGDPCRSRAGWTALSSYLTTLAVRPELPLVPQTPQSLAQRYAPASTGLVSDAARALAKRAAEPDNGLLAFAGLPGNPRLDAGGRLRIDVLAVTP